RSPSWSPDGTKIAVSAVTNPNGENYEVFVISVVDGQIKPLTVHEWNHIASTAWLPDGSALVMVAKEKGVRDASQLWHVSYPEGTARRILSDLDSYGAALSLSADGELLIAVQMQRITNIWVSPAADLSQAKQITFSSVGRRDGWENLDWTPDDQLLYGAIIRDSLTIWTMGVDGTYQKQLTSAGHWDSQLSTTADGRYMVFSSNRGGTFEIWRARVDGSDMKQLTSTGDNKEPHVSPNGKWVVYTSTRRGTLWKVSTEGGEPVRLSDQPASWPRISPNGNFIAYGCTGQTNPSRTQLAIIPFAGGRPVKVFDVPRLANFAYGIRWTPDGKSVTYRDSANGIWRQSLEGGEPERLSGLPEEKLYAYAWSRHGKQFAFVRGAEIRDVVLLQNMN
ncbi:MAG: TolB family protein, partial [Pyrinomonadaceae bacterium]